MVIYLFRIHDEREAYRRDKRCLLVRNNPDIRLYLVKNRRGSDHLHRDYCKYGNVVDANRGSIKRN